MRGTPIRFLVLLFLALFWVDVSASKRPRFVVSLSGDKRIDTYEIGDSGALVRLSKTSLDAKPGALRFRRDGSVLYAAGSEPHSISTFEVAADSLSNLGMVEVDDKPSFLQLTPSGRFLVSAYYRSGQVTVHRVEDQKALVKQAVQVKAIDERAHGVVINRSGEFVFVPHTRPNCITQFRIDDRSGELSPNDPAKFQRGPNTGPRHLSFHPTTNFVYGSDEQGLSVTVYRMQAETGVLNQLQTISSVPDGFQGKGSTSDIHVHPSGRFVYIANRGHGSIASFSIDQESGHLQPLERVATESVVRSFAISQDGRYLVAAGQRSGKLICYRIGDDGRLNQKHSIEAGKTPWWVAFIPDANPGSDVRDQLSAFDPGRVPRPSGSSPNVLFISVDDMNNYVSGMNPEIRALTPRIDALASRGRLFTNAHCAAPACNPSRTSVMTGVAPHVSGVYENRQDWRECSRLRGVTTLPEHFRNQGYKVVGAGKLYHAANLREEMRAGYFDERPWHEYFPSKELQLAHATVPPGQSINGSNRFYGGRFDWDEVETPDEKTGDGQVVAWAERQLSKSHSGPLFLAVGIYRPHIPWYTPKKWFEAYQNRSTRIPSAIPSDLDDLPESGKRMARTQWHQWLVENEKWDDAVAAYLASTSFADAMVGRLIDALDRGPLAENTIIVLWSDHGYHTGQKQHWEKFALWEQSTQVPLIIADTRLTYSNGSCDRPVSLLDLYPTLIDLCNLPNLRHLQGKSLKRYLGDPTAMSDRAVLTTQKYNNHSVRSQHYRYIRYSDGAEELYDHRVDPGETNNLAMRPEFAGTKLLLARYLPSKDAPSDPPLE